MRGKMRIFCILGLIIWSIPGCSSLPAKAAPVDTELAMVALSRFLEAWQDGKSIDALVQEQPPIVGQDFDWMKGESLAGYRVLGSGVAQDANLRVEVELNLSDRAGKRKTKRVAYIVGTDRTLTVFRAFE